MDLAGLEELARSIEDQQALAKSSEEATKAALVRPLLRLLGYRPDDLTQVAPEFQADVGVKKGEKVDYAILSAGEPLLLVEVKKCGQKLGPHHLSQLFRYFSATQASFAALTNGIEWQFFSDLSEQNKMDMVPFLKLDLSTPSEATVRRLELFSAGFDAKKLRSRALRMKDVRIIKAFLEEQKEKLAEELVELLARHARPEVKKWTPRRIGDIRAATTEAFKEFLREHVERQPDPVPPPPPPPKPAKCWWTYQGKTHPAKSWAALYVAVVSRLYHDHGEVDFYERLRERIHGSKLSHVGQSRADAGGRPVKLPGSWWLNVNHTQVTMRRNVKRACEAARIKYGRDLVVK